MNRRGFIRMLVAAPVSRALPWNGIARALETIAPTVALEIDTSLDELLTETIRKYSAQIVENIAANNAFLNYLKNQKC